MRMRHAYTFHNIVELLNEITGIYSLILHSSGPSASRLVGSRT
jgi:hypothetical protein